MNNKILLTGALIAGSLFANAQQRMAYAVTGDGNKDFTWMNIRQVDLKTGQVTKNVFERSVSNFSMTDLESKRVITSVPNDNVYYSPEYPTGTFVAAAAYDKNTNKLFFTPMRLGELRWMDMNAAERGRHEFYSISIPGYKPVTDYNDESGNITRMVIGADGYGYALSNDGNHFYKFTTGKKPTIVDLGAIMDDESNNTISIHNRCSCWGGDMIGDAFGKLYVISASHNVFMIDPSTRIAKHLGTINGLPATYTTNAAAVNEEGEIIVASANVFDGYYKLKLNDLKAEKMIGSDVVYNVSDFANANLLLQKEANALASGNVPDAAKASSDAKIFPNPVTNSSFNVLFDGQTPGNYTVIVSDLAGRNVATKSVTIANEGSRTEQVKLRSNLTKGVYIVRVLNSKNSIVINEKIVIQ